MKGMSICHNYEYLCWQLQAIKHIPAGCELSLKKNKKSSYQLALTREGSSEWKIAPRGGQLPQSLAGLSIQAEKSLAEAIIAVSMVIALNHPMIYIYIYLKLF